MVREEEEAGAPRTSLLRGDFVRTLCGADGTAGGSRVPTLVDTQERCHRHRAEEGEASRTRELFERARVRADGGSGQVE